MKWKKELVRYAAPLQERSILMEILLLVASVWLASVLLTAVFLNMVTKTLMTPKDRPLMSEILKTEGGIPKRKDYSTGQKKDPKAIHSRKDRHSL